MIEAKKLEEAEVDMTYFRILSFIQVNGDFMGSNFSSIETVNQIPYINKMYEKIKIYVDLNDLNNLINQSYNKGVNGSHISLKDANNILCKATSYGIDDNTYYDVQKYITRISRVAYVSGYCNNH